MRIEFCYVIICILICIDMFITFKTPEVNVWSYRLILGLLFINFIYRIKEHRIIMMAKEIIKKDNKTFGEMIKSLKLPGEWKK